jgi:trehalose 6-phosphate synthase
VGRVTDLPVVLLSHRGPVSFERDESGRRTASRGAGGLVTALTGLVSDLPDAEAAPTARLRLVEVDGQAHDDFYTVIANPLLWFLQHGMYGLALDLPRRKPDAGLAGGHLPRSGRARISSYFRSL